ncbi:hypothetical protein ACTXT7_000783 [Hymenolepis weldensis]
MSNAKEMPKPREFLKFPICKNTILANIHEGNDAKGIWFRKNKIFIVNCSINMWAKDTLT